MERDDQILGDLTLIKKSSFVALEASNNLLYLAKEKEKMKKSLDQAFLYKLSTSLIIIGSSKEECVGLVKSALSGYANECFHATSLGDRHSKLKNYTARVDGALHNSDQEALLDIANQFLLRREGEGNTNMALEELEEHFRQCRCDGIPAIIVIEDFHVFTKRKRQTLIYALLDLMHKRDLLFTIVGITNHSDVEVKLEKRVMSRLNAQYIFVSKATGGDVCEYFHSVFTIPAERIGTAEESRTADGTSGRTPSRKRSNTGERVEESAMEAQRAGKVTAAFAQRFNAALEDLCGKYTEPAAAETIAPAAVLPELSSDGFDDSTAECSPPCDPRRTFSPGKLWEVLGMHCDWGRDLSYFTRVGLRVACWLSPDSPLITLELVQRALASLEPESIEEVLAGLSSLELHLFVSVLHVHGRAQQAGAAAGARAEEERPQVNLVERVLTVCDMLTEVFKQKTVPKGRVAQALCGLAQKGLIFLLNPAPGRQTVPVGSLSLGVQGAVTAGSSSVGNVTARTLVALNVSYEQAVEAFCVRRGPEDGYETGRRRVTVPVSERMRRAVLEPIVPVTYQQQQGKSSAVTSLVL